MGVYELLNGVFWALHTEFVTCFNKVTSQSHAFLRFTHKQRKQLRDEQRMVLTTVLDAAAVVVQHARALNHHLTYSHHLPKRRDKRWSFLHCCTYQVGNVETHQQPNCPGSHVFEAGAVQ